MLPEGSSLSNWEKPGGKTGMVVLGLLGAGGLMLFYKALPFLITLASNTLYLGLLLGLIAGIIYLLCDPKFRKICSATYFMLMRKLTGLVIEIDPIAIVEQRIRDMQKKSADIKKVMGDLRGCIIRSKNDIQNDTKEMRNCMDEAQVSERNGNVAMATIQKRQALRLKESLDDQLLALKNSEMWFEKLKKLEEYANLTIQDVTNEVNIRKKTFERIRAQHKAFKSVMSIVKGDPDELAMFTDAMDFMAKDISDKIGEMEHVIDSTTGMLADLDAKNGVANMRAEELLERYNKSGIDSLFNKFSDSRKAISAPKVGEYVQFQEILKVPVNGILGKSGCGKSQLLKIISGLTKPDSGEVLVYGKPQTGKIPMVFQQYSSFPWMSVLDNVKLPLILRGVSDKEATEKAMEMIKIVGLEGNETKWGAISCFIRRTTPESFDGKSVSCG